MVRLGALVNLKFKNRVLPGGLNGIDDVVIGWVPMKRTSLPFSTAGKVNAVAMTPAPSTAILSIFVPPKMG